MSSNKLKATRKILQAEIQEKQDLVRVIQYLEQGNDFAMLRAHSLICRDLGIEVDKIPKPLHDLVYAGKLRLSDSMKYYLHEGDSMQEVKSIREFIRSGLPMGAL